MLSPGARRLALLVLAVCAATGAAIGISEAMQGSTRPHRSLPSGGSRSRARKRVAAGPAAGATTSATTRAVAAAAGRSRSGGHAGTYGYRVGGRRARKHHRRHRFAHRAAGNPPNIVFVLTDDLSMDLLRYMPVVQQLQRAGLTFTNYYVSDSLCCPSRASIFTGDFPHDTGIFNNAGKHGGFATFYARGEEHAAFNVALQSVGYRTAMMGKYLNGYLQSPAKGGTTSVPASYVPSGWNEWDVAGWGYPEFNYLLNENGAVNFFGNAPNNYLTDVMAQKGVQFINSSVATHQPFFLELATFAPHSPYVPAPRDANLFPGLTYPEGPNFDTLPVDAPSWLSWRTPLTAAQIATVNQVFRLRAQDVQSVDDMIAAIEQALRTDGVAGNTYIVFSSDNGIHDGEYRLMPGKMTAFDTDIHVPLIVTGPGVAPNTTNSDFVENIDLAKTFAQIGGVQMSNDGQSLLDLFHGGYVPNWRNAILVEHLGRALFGDPDYQGPASGDPPSYEAIRTRRYLYVEYRDGQHEFYDLLDDPYELDNIYNLLSARDKALLHSELLAMENCHDGPTCWTAMHVSNSNPPY